MKKIKNLVIGGIQNKIFNLVLLTIILLMGAYTAVILYQASRLSGIVSETGEKQTTSMRTISEETMTSVINASLGQSTQLEAYITNDIFAHLISEVDMMWDYAHRLYADPGGYPPGHAAPPSAANDGTVCTQLLTEEGIDVDSPAVAADLALVSNMSDLLNSLYVSEELVNACFIGTEQGILLISDEVSGTKVGTDGTPIDFNVRERPWYRGAADSGEIYMTELYIDGFTGLLGLTCSRPVYDLSGNLRAVVGADLFLGSMQEAVQESNNGGSFVCVINENGHVVFSPETEGIFRADVNEDSEDLREAADHELAKFVGDAMSGVTDVRLVETSEGLYYMAGAPMESVGWALISLVPKEVADQPTVMMQEKYDDINAEAVKAYRGSMDSAKVMMLVILAVLSILAVGNGLILSKKIVSPINKMAESAKAISGDNPEFKMDPAYMTGDEIEILADSFVELSAKTRRYIGDITRITAEKERISAELNVASQIQGDMLPSIFPPYPDRDEFDLYANMNPAKEVGGDFFDFFMTDDDHLVLVMADVSGKGVPAALFMVIAKTHIKNRAQMGGTPSEILAYVNDQLCEGNEAELFVTVWLCILEISTGKCTVTNAGHEHPVVRRDGGRYEFEIYKHSPAVAVMEGMQFEEHVFRLNPGDSIFIYTDGLAEATDPSDELFGSARIIEALNRAPEASPRQVLTNVGRAVSEFVGKAEQFDDTTMLCLKYFGKK
ncbi:MAG: SpoIIE family protein phosphatase [Lachnospiraceae bacterium]|nr:SpoIIE family protein phosphatase [Lachnospiraceae bacterium]